MTHLHNQNEIKLRSLIYYSSDMILWYHSVRKFELIDIREIYFTSNYSDEFISTVERIEMQCKNEMKMQLLQTELLVGNDLFDVNVLQVISKF